MEEKRLILCGIFGDIIGQHYEFGRIPMKRKDFKLFYDNSTFTDDTMCSLAVMKWLTGDMKDSLSDIMRKLCRGDIRRGYSGTFYKWILSDDMGDYHSWGNGSGMRVSPVGWYTQTEEECLDLAKQTAEITHGHPEGIKGAQAVALCVFMAKNGKDKTEIKNRVSKLFGYDLDRKLDDIRQTYKFDVSCQGSVPEAIISFLESTSVEDAVRNAVSLGGDTDTQGIMAGAIAEAYYFDDVWDEIYNETIKRIPPAYMDIIEKFNDKITK